MRSTYFNLINLFSACTYLITTQGAAQVTQNNNLTLETFNASNATNTLESRFFELAPEKIDSQIWGDEDPTELMRSATTLQIEGKNKRKSNLPKEAHDNFVKAIELINKISPSKMSNPWLANKADLHHEMARFYFNEKQWEQGRGHLFKAISACRKIPNDKKALKNWISLSIYNGMIGASYYEMNDMDNAKKYTSRSRDNLVSDIPAPLLKEAKSNEEYKEQLNTIETLLDNLKHRSQGRLSRDR